MSKILDAKYAPANWHEVGDANAHLSKIQKIKLHTLLSQHAQLFKGTLGKWEGNPCHVELREGVKPYHATRTAFLMRTNAHSVWKVERLCKVGVLQKNKPIGMGCAHFYHPEKGQNSSFYFRF